MSQDNVEGLRAFWDALTQEPWTLESPLLARWREGDLDADLLDPEVAYEDTILPDHVGETYRGPDGVRRATERWIEPFEWLKIELDRIVGDGDQLVSIHRVQARARYTGIEFEAQVAYFWTFRDSKVTHFRSYWNAQEALAAAGLEE
jgi:ketosteroid isomerase-like protein